GAERRYGGNCPQVAAACNRLAALLRETTRAPEAEPPLRRALAIDEQSYGPNHPAVARNLNNLARWLRATNRLAEAEPLYRRALRILVLTSVQSGHDSPDLQTVRGNYSSCLKERGRTNAEVSVELEGVEKEARAQLR